MKARSSLYRACATPFSHPHPCIDAVLVTSRTGETLGLVDQHHHRREKRPARRQYLGAATPTPEVFALGMKRTGALGTEKESCMSYGMPMMPSFNPPAVLLPPSPDL